MTYLLLIYDIESGRARTKIADACLDYGLDRIQYSAFAGELSRNHQQELMLRIGKLLGKGDGRITLVPVCEKDWQGRLEINHVGP
jgi:CRISPR-associated protein Cas2